MKIALLTALLAAGAIAAHSHAPRKAVIVTYPTDTPDAVIEKAMRDIEDGGGTVTHQYKLFKGFAANAPVKALDAVQAEGSEFPATVEEDEMVTASNLLRS